MRRGSKPSLAGLLLLSLASVGGARAEAANSLSLQGGWWSVEGEIKLRFGVYAALGVPYPLFFLSPSARWVVPLSVRVGYQYEASPRWKLRAAAHLAGAASSEDPCGDCYQTVVRAYQFVEVGLRYEGPSGFVAGLDVPIVAFKNGHEIYRGNFDRLRSYPGPAFTQVYAGYAWRY
jgi:hypothetical protein